MTNIAIRVENLSKQYRIGTQRARYKTIRESLVEAVASPLRRLSGNSKFAIRNSQLEYIWALKDVSFEIKQSEVIGIIGRNGAGKSTLLKILSRITRPTHGRAEIHGRVGSLLEVGTGFHPELTGRENIYLNGAILGMRKAEIERNFDQIVAFSEVEKFIDTPVKHYSSGMYVRLAFAVAAHLEPEILLVDEVLAVGDAAFQKKCLGKMGDVAKEGRTVVLVSHQMAAVQNLCPRSILLNHGEVFTDDRTELVIAAYLRESADLLSIPLADRVDRRGSGALRFLSVSIENEHGEEVGSMVSGQSASLVIKFENTGMDDLRIVSVAMGIDSYTGERIALLSSDLTHDTFPVVPAHSNRIEIHIDRVPFTPGKYGFTLFASVNGAIADWIQNAGTLDVDPGDYFRTGKLPPASQGHFLVDHCFRVGGPSG